ncbi:hypothetical protein P308_16610 [Pseudomonas piscis]|nr:hypothetical protein P308_16610 [Pseudomonas piscis]
MDLPTMTLPLDGAASTRTRPLMACLALPRGQLNETGESGRVWRLSVRGVLEVPEVPPWTEHQ